MFLFYYIKNRKFIDFSRMDYDEILLKLFISETGRSKTSLLRKIELYPNICNYLNNRFKDYSINYKEILDRIRFRIEKRPTCKLCGNDVKYKGLLNGIPTYKEYCSCSCAQKSKETRRKYKENCINKYGVDNTFKIKEVQEKRKKTLFNNYGVIVPSKSEIIKNKIKNTCIEKYGCESPLGNSDIRKTIENTFMNKYGSISPLGNKEFIRKKIKEKYGVEFITQTNFVKKKIKESLSSEYSKQKRINTNINRYGVPYPGMCESIKQRKNDTKRKNHTFNTSKPEKELFLYIKKKFPDAVNQYRDSIRYPFNCDFYIPSKDYFIELNVFHGHGGHPFDSNSIDDLNKLHLWKNKYDNGLHPMYLNMIKVWTIRDVEKRNCAKEHNLNFKEVWSLKEGKEFIDSL